MSRWLALCGLVLASPLAKADPQQVVINHQGRLLGGDDQPVEGAVRITVALYASAEDSSARWTEIYEVTPSRGAYALALGDTSGGKKALTTDDLAQAAFLGIHVNGSALNPRLRVGTAATAARALLASQADLAARATMAADSEKLGGTAATQYALKSYVDSAVAAATPVGLAQLAGADFTGPVTVQAPTQANQPATKSYVDGANQTQDQAVSQQLQNLFKGAPAFAPTSGNVPFTVAPGANGVVTNLNAELLGGFKASDFVLATSAPKVFGAERLVLNFDEGSGGGTSVVDASGLGNNGSFVASSLTRTANGRNGSGALTFVAGGGAVTVPDGNALDVTNNVTVEAWVNPSANPASEGIIALKDGAYGLRMTSAGQLQALMQTTVTGTSAWVGSSPALALNTWSHVAAVYDGVQIKLYVNGQLVAFLSAPNGPLNANNNPLTVGGRANVTSAAFVGTIDEVRVSAQAKTFRDSVPRVLSVRDNRAGCPGSLAANADQMIQTFTLTKTTAIFAVGKNIRNAAGRADLVLAVDGNTADVDITYTPTATWVGGHVQWSGVLGPGQHSISVRGDIANTWGCGTGYGSLDIVLFE